MKKLKLAILLLSFAMVGVAATGCSNNSTKPSGSTSKVVKSGDDGDSDNTGGGSPTVTETEPTFSFSVSGSKITKIKVENLTGNEIEELVIPDEIEGTTITSVSRAFSDSSLSNKKIKKLVIGKNLTNMDFSDTEGKILDIEVSEDNTKYVKSGKFLLSHDLKTLYWGNEFSLSELPSTVEVLESYSLINMTDTTLNIPGHVKELKSYVTFKEFQSVVLNEGLEKINNNALRVDGTIEIPASVTQLYALSFTGIKGITVKASNPKYDSRNNCNMVIETASNKVVLVAKTYVFPTSVTEIGVDAFAYTYNFSSITIPSTVKKIHFGAFRFCYNLVSLQLPSDVEIYTSNTAKSDDLEDIIEGCYKLKSFTCPSTVTKISSTDFYGLDALEKIYLPVLTSINSDVFAKTPQLKKIYTKMTVAQWNALNYQDTSGRLADIEIIFNASSMA